MARTLSLTLALALALTLIMRVRVRVGPNMSTRAEATRKLVPEIDSGSTAPSAPA